VILMMPCCFLGEKSLSCGGDVSFAGIGEGLVRLLMGIVAENPNADFVGRSFDSKDGCLTVRIGADVVQRCRGNGKIPNGIRAGIIGGCWVSSHSLCEYVCVGVIVCVCCCCVLG